MPTAYTQNLAMAEHYTVRLSMCPKQVTHYLNTSTWLTCSLRRIDPSTCVSDDECFTTAALYTFNGVCSSPEHHRQLFLAEEMRDDPLLFSTRNRHFSALDNEFLGCDAGSNHMTWFSETGRFIRCKFSISWRVHRWCRQVSKSLWALVWACLFSNSFI